jgi:hypothetical protein
MKNLYQPNVGPFKFVRIGDIELTTPGACGNPDAEMLGRNIGRHILENMVRGHDTDETLELIADALARCDGILPQYRVDVLTAVAGELFPVLRAGLGRAGWPDQGGTTK